jgi:hypothetical protein
MLWFSHLSKINALTQRIDDLERQISEYQDFIHTDAFHELIDAKFDETKFDDLAQEAIERAVENADVSLRVRF